MYNYNIEKEPVSKNLAKASCIEDNFAKPSYVDDNLAKDIMNSVKTSFMDSTYESMEEYRAKLLYNDSGKGNTVLANLQKELNACESFWFSVAFITKSGLIVLKETLKEIQEKGVTGRILTTDYLEFNEPDALRELLNLKNIEVKVFTKEHFHTKGYMFKRGERNTFVVGSSNMTQNALKENKEWNLRVTSLDQGELIKETLFEFDLMWGQAEKLTEAWISEYEKHYRDVKAVRDKQKLIRINIKHLR